MQNQNKTFLHPHESIHKNHTNHEFFRKIKFKYFTKKFMIFKYKIFYINFWIIIIGWSNNFE